MITKDIKISELLKQHPGLKDTLLRINPGFDKLENGLLEKIIGERVTVEQAAAIAGADLEDLLNKLNDYKSADNIDKTVTEQEAAASQGTHIFQEGTAIDSESIITLDVRPILDSGKDPLKDILAKIKELKTGDILLIINSFEPFPLYTLLEKKGFQHRTEKENDIYRIYFYRIEDSQGSLPAVNAELSEDDFENIINLDVHELQPPEPMMKILENLHRVDEKSVMLVYHHREPNLLYPKLEERGYQAACHKLGEDNYKILISKKKADK